MKIAKRILLVFLILISLALIIGFLFLQNLKTAAIPDYNENVEMPGLTDEVTVLHDGFGIPRVYAKTENDLYKAVGFDMAQDKFWQMDLLRRVTQGKLSEIYRKNQYHADPFSNEEVINAAKFTMKIKPKLSCNYFRIIRSALCRWNLVSATKT